MSCLYNNWKGVCSLFEDSCTDLGCNSSGVCVCDCDPDPMISCSNYETDSYCPECDTDLNIDECTCSEE